MPSFLNSLLKIIQMSGGAAAIVITATASLGRLGFDSSLQRMAKYEACSSGNYSFQNYYKHHAQKMLIIKSSWFLVMAIIMGIGSKNNKGIFIQIPALKSLPRFGGGARGMFLLYHLLLPFYPTSPQGRPPNPPGGA